MWGHMHQRHSLRWPQRAASGAGLAVVWPRSAVQWVAAVHGEAYRRQISFSGLRGAGAGLRYGGPFWLKAAFLAPSAAAVALVQALDLDRPSSSARGKIGDVPKWGLGNLSFRGRGPSRPGFAGGAGSQNGGRNVCCPTDRCSCRSASPPAAERWCWADCLWVPY
jgi:hypothetical protein